MGSEYTFVDISKYITEGNEENIKKESKQNFSTPVVTCNLVD